MNRRERRHAQRQIRKAIRTGVGVSTSLAGYRVIRPDGTVKVAVGLQPGERKEDRS